MMVPLDTLGWMVLLLVPSKIAAYLYVPFLGGVRWMVFRMEDGTSAQRQI